MKNTIGIETFNPSHDVYGNPTAHFTVWYNGDILLSQHNRRAQIGYCGRINRAALYAINKLGFNVDESGISFDRNGEIVYYPITSIDDEQGAFMVEVTDLFGGELNYSCMSRYKVYAKTVRGAISKLSKHTGLNFRAYVSGEVYHSTSKSTGATIEPYNLELHGELSGVNEL